MTFWRNEYSNAEPAELTRLSETLYKQCRNIEEVPFYDGEEIMSYGFKYETRNITVSELEMLNSITEITVDKAKLEAQEELVENLISEGIL